MPAITSIPLSEAVRLARSARGGIAADGGLTAFEAPRLTGAIVDALVAQVAGEGAFRAAGAGRAHRLGSAPVGKTTWRRAIVLDAGKTRRAALAVNADLVTNAVYRTPVIAVCAGRADAFIVLAADLVCADTVTAGDGLARLAAASNDSSALGTTRTRSSAGNFLASADEVLPVRSAECSFGTGAALDRTVASVREGAALDRDSNALELRDDLLAGLRLACWLLRVVATIVAAPAEVATGAVGRLAAGEEPVFDQQIATRDSEDDAGKDEHSAMH